MNTEAHMTSQSDKGKPAGKRKPDADKEKARQEEKKHLNDVLDEGLEESFPASDTPAVVRPGHGIPSESDKD
jgi:hypothetical protein